MKKFLFSILIAFLILPFVCFGAVSYSRSPLGYLIQSPVNFSVSFDDLWIDGDCGEEPQGWGVEVSDGEGPFSDYASNFVATTTLSQTFQLDLPNGFKAVSVYIQCEINGDGYELEGIGAPPAIFEIHQPFLVLPTNAISSTTSFIADLFTGAGPLIWLAIGLPLAFYVVRKVISLVAARAK